jgi:hypothetical protein
VLRVRGEQLLQLALDPVEGEPPLGVELVADVLEDLLELDRELLPFGLVTTQRPGSSRRVLGAFIQFTGLYAPTSAWIATHPSALTMIRRTADVSVDDRRPS